MRFYVGITDRDWFEHVSRIEALDEVNFWQPSGNVQFKALQEGDLLFRFSRYTDCIFQTVAEEVITYAAGHATRD